MKQPSFDSDPSDVLLPNSGADDGILASASSAPGKQQQLNESAATSVTGGDTDNSCSENEEETGAGWLGGIGADFRTLAASLRETAGAAASLIRTSAVNVANEIALLEDEEGGGNVSGGGGAGAAPLYLPWEVPNEQGEYQEDEELKKKIFDLSREERNFFEPYSSSRNKSDGDEEEASEDDEDASDFALDDARVQIIRRLLKADPPLSSVHARLSGRSDIRETTFWRNYFHACDETRELHLGCLELDQKLEALYQKSSPSQRSVNSLVPDEESSRDRDDQNSKSGDDDESSFVCLSAGKSSPPGSVRSGKSTGSLVIVEAPSSSNSVSDYFSGK